MIMWGVCVFASMWLHHHHHDFCEGLLNLTVVTYLPIHSTESLEYEWQSLHYRYRLYKEPMDNIVAREQNALVNVLVFLAVLVVIWIYCYWAVIGIRYHNFHRERDART